MIRAVVTDLDNTLYSWIDYIVPSMEAMVDSLIASTGAPRNRVVQALKAVYERYESNEYPFAIQESALFQDQRDGFDTFEALVIEPARQAFSTARRRHLRLYPGVRETLEALRAVGIKIAALTDAPRNPAERRVQQLELDPLLDGLYTMPAFAFPESGIASRIAARERAGGIQLVCPVIALPRAFEKPDPRGFARVCADLGVEPSEILLIGDSLAKDIALAREAGALDVWAEYGTSASAEYIERLAEISARSAMRRHWNHAKAGITPTHAVSSFGRILDLVSVPPEPRAVRTPPRSSRRAGSARGT